MAGKTKRRKGSGEADRGKVVRETCNVVWCIDPRTGELRAYPGKCPPGFLDKARRAMREKGIVIEESSEKDSERKKS